MTWGTTLRSRLLIFGGLYFAQGVPWGFFTVAIVLRLTSLGLSPAGLGDLMFVASLPWAGKPVIGLLVDRLSFGRLGRRRPFILLAEAGMALSLLAMAFANPISDRPLFSALLFLHNLLAAAQDVGTDALAIDLLAENERSRANGIMSASKFAGVVLGGQGLLWVASVAGWPAAFGLAIALLLVPATLVIGVRESPLPTQRPRLLRLTLRAFSSRIVLLAAGFALVVDLADSLTFPLTYPLFRNQLGFSEQQVASLATLGGIAGALGSLLGSAAVARSWGRAWAWAASTSRFPRAKDCGGSIPYSSRTRRWKGSWSAWSMPPRWRSSWISPTHAWPPRNSRSTWPCST